MHFGLHYLLSCSPNQQPGQRYRETIEQAIRGEALGFESVWPVEQHFSRGASVMPCPALLLSAIAARTSKLRLGTGIVQLPLHHPVRVAEEMATLDVLSGGRVEIGVGRGSNPMHYRGFGISQHDSRERFVEGLEVLRGMFCEEEFSFAGKFYGVSGASLSPRPLQLPHPSIRIAANSIETAKWAGRAGYPVLFATNVNPLPRLPKLMAAYRDAREAGGKGPATPEDVTILMPLFVAQDAAEARAVFEPTVRHYAQLSAAMAAAALKHCDAPAEREMLEMVQQRANSLTYEQVDDAIGVLGSPADCIRKLEQVQRDFNPGRVITWFNFGGVLEHTAVMRSMELFANRVMPHFQSDNERTRNWGSPFSAFGVFSSRIARVG